MIIEIKHIIYLLASISFITGLKMLSNPKTARNGNLLAAAGMIGAIIAAIIFHKGEVSTVIYGLIFGAIAIGTVVGWITAKKVQMTKMPELVSLFMVSNGFIEKAEQAMVVDRGNTSNTLRSGRTGRGRLHY